ncbi:MAG TPA: hypothetical protein VGN46_14115 [Luteibacter sp.]|jgi:MFS family permease|uniref:hypothetical protein n=1 Tax=Luteibacter sp. TaxID=1886636 RepID=UPI002F40C417
MNSVELNMAKPGVSPAFRVVVARGLSSTATFAVLPYLAVVILDGHLASASLAAMVVGIYVLCLRAGGIISGLVVHVLGARRPLPWLYLAAAAFLVLGMVAMGARLPLGFLAVALFANALSVAVANVLTKATIAAAADDRQRVLAFGALSRAINGGAAVGGLAGSVAAPHGTLAVLLPASLLVALAGISCLRLPKVRADAVAVHVTVGAGAWGRRITFVVATAMVWLAYVQFFAVLPVYARGTPAEEWVGVAFAVNAVMIVGLQQFVLKHAAPMFDRVSHQWRVYLAACGCIGLSLVLLCAIRTAAWPLLFAAIVLLTISELFWSPLLDAWTASVFGPKNLLGAYTITGLAWGGAEALGSSLSIPVAAGSLPGVPWYAALVVSGVVVIAAALCLRSAIDDQAVAGRAHSRRLARRKGKREAASGGDAPTPTLSYRLFR